MDIWIVEDMFSSKRLEQEGLKSVALLGTHMSDTLVKDILDYSPYAKVFLALDEDATAKAVQYRRCYGAIFRNFIIVPLDKDIKDMTNSELTRLIQKYE